MIVVIEAPTNLGLRPPAPGAVPGTGKAPDALREAGLQSRLAAAGAGFAGVVLPGRYLDDGDAGAQRLRNQAAIVDHARRIADRIGTVLDNGGTPLVLGGDCSLLVGAGLALARRGGAALVHVDGHTDFRHPGNSTACASLAGEDLAAAVGRHWPAVADIDRLGPYFAPDRVAHVGCRDADDELDEVRSTIAVTVTAREWIENPAEALTRLAAVTASPYWLHLDVDVLDPSHLPAVDSPDPGGLSPEQLTVLLQALAPRAVGAQVCVFDPDLDPDGRHARMLADLVLDGLSQLGPAPY